MAKVYLAGPLFTKQDRDLLEQIAEIVPKSGHEVHVPHLHSTDAARKDSESRRAVYEANISAIDGCDCIVALLDGVDVDSGTAFEVGYAKALDIPVMGIRTDYRTLGSEGTVNLMIQESCDRFTWSPTADLKMVRLDLEKFLSSEAMRVGRLVRDNVPKLVSKAGYGDISFREASKEEMPKLLKKKILEEAKELMHADWSHEQEEIGDLLEVLETLIETRGFDRESLRMVKQKKLRERGGFKKCMVLEG